MSVGEGALDLSAVISYLALVFVMKVDEWLLLLNVTLHEYWQSRHWQGSSLCIVNS